MIRQAVSVHLDPKPLARLRHLQSVTEGCPSLSALVNEMVSVGLLYSDPEYRKQMLFTK
jgi:hypothetical protein